MASEGSRTATWLQSALASLSAGGAWRNVAPPNQDITAPYAIYIPYPGGLGDLRGVGARRIWSERYWLIKAVGPASQEAAVFALADAIDARLEHALHEAAGADCLMLSCIRIDDYGPVDEIVGAATWLNVGGIYRIRVKFNS